MQTFCQWALLVQFVISFFTLTYQDFNGRSEKSPEGFGGFVGTCVGIGLGVATAWGAGAFDNLVGY